MQKKMKSFIEEHHMLKKGDCVLAAVSGGADSICLLTVLLGLRQEWDLRLCAVHVEHGIRGEDSLQDARFVERFCESHQVPLEVFHCKAKDYAKAHKMTVEEGARDLRYGFFAKAAEGFGADKVAVAHNQDDWAETMLFHLFRGTGIRGLAGMEPKRDSLIRPLLCVERREIMEWLRAQELSWCEDSTNQEENYTRNRIRHTILSCAREQINEGAVRHMIRTAEELSEIERFLEEADGKAFRLCVREEEREYFIFEEAFRRLQPLLRKRLIRRCLAGLGGGLKDLDRRHIELVEELFEKRTGSRLSLPGGRTGIREYGGVSLRWEEPETERQEMEELPAVEIPGTCGVGDVRWFFSLENAQKDQIIPEKAYTKWFDYDKIENYPVIRRRMSGDYLEINREHGHKKLKDYLIDAKVPAEERDRLLLLADGSHIIWIPGMRISEYYKVTEDTRQILKVQIYGGKEDGGEDPSDDSGG